MKATREREYPELWLKEYRFTPDKKMAESLLHTSTGQVGWALNVCLKRAGQGVGAPPP